MFGCEGSHDASASTDAHVEIRIASLSPAMTSTLIDLGFESELVGRSPWCADLSKSLPVVGDFRDFDPERLLLARPTHMVLQPPLSGINPALVTFAEKQGIELIAMPLDRMQDVRAFVARAALLATDPSRAHARLTALDAMSEVDSSAPRVIVLVNADPMLVAGSANYLADLLPLVALRNAVEREGWVECSHESLGLLEPDLLLGIAEREDNVALLQRTLAAIPCKAAREGRILVVIASELLRPSTRALDAMQALKPAIEAALASGKDAAP